MDVLRSRVSMHWNDLKYVKVIQLLTKKENQELHPCTDILNTARRMVRRTRRHRYGPFSPGCHGTDRAIDDDMDFDYDY
jgi:hypothetical protein